MKIGRVIGRVVLSKKDARLDGATLIVVSPLVRGQLEHSDKSLMSKSSLVVYDGLGARGGDLVSYVEGAEATAPFASPIPIDAYNVGIVDKYTYNRNVE